MKKTIQFIICILTILISTFVRQANAQVPQSINYQAVVIDSAGTTIKNQNIGVRVSILAGMPTGAAVYTERQTMTSDKHGLISFEIGTGAVETGDFSSINWATGSYFIKTETDIKGGTDYSITGVSQILSVPYAHYADKSGSNVKGPAGPQGDPGTKGDDGQSAYEIWLSLGNTGSEADFLASLTGPPGDPGSGNSFTHELGDEFEGGIIFHQWRDPDGSEHGLIVSKDELYVNPLDPLEGIEWSNVYNGEIGPAAQSSWDGKSNTEAIISQSGHNHGAAQLCSEYESAGFDDWYLPSVTELLLMWANRFSINKALADINDAKRISSNATYWSSTEYSSNQAYYIFFFNGDQSNFQNKNAGFKVRAVRRF